MSQTRQQGDGRDPCRGAECGGLQSTADVIGGRILLWLLLDINRLRLSIISLYKSVTCSRKVNECSTPPHPLKEFKECSVKKQWGFNFGGEEMIRWGGYGA